MYQLIEGRLERVLRSILRAMRRDIGCADAGSQGSSLMQIIATIFVFVWMGLVVVGVIGVIRGRVLWARIGSRRAAGWVLGSALPVFILIGVVAPKQDSTQSVPAPLVAAPAPALSTTTAAAAPPPINNPVPVPEVNTPAPVLPTVEVWATVPARSQPSTAVTPGAFCSDAGATGYTKSGTLMVCETSATDSRLRWRHA
ncbi:hypothetical protein [Nocardia sp. NPDC056100]|uniref:hypothetical protein n=1 Tax=Nocardia sp. NPDC056100 TaxID=3345712 RepID=UPI0035DA0BC2